MELALRAQHCAVRLPRVVALRLGLVHLQVVQALVVFMVQAAHLAMPVETSMVAVAAMVAQAQVAVAVLVVLALIIMAAVEVLLLLVLVAPVRVVRV